MYLRAAVDAAPDDVHDLQARAAYQYLISGRIDEGLAACIRPHGVECCPGNFMADQERRFERVKHRRLAHLVGPAENVHTVAERLDGGRSGKSSESRDTEGKKLHEAAPRRPSAAKPASLRRAVPATSRSGFA